MFSKRGRRAAEGSPPPALGMFYGGLAERVSADPRAVESDARRAADREDSPEPQSDADEAAQYFDLARDCALYAGEYIEEGKPDLAVGAVRSVVTMAEMAEVIDPGLADRAQRLAEGAVEAFERSDTAELRRLGEMQWRE